MEYLPTRHLKNQEQCIFLSDPRGYQKRAILPYVLFLVTAAMFVGRMELNEEVI
jgi:hypothetical protein